MEINAHLRAAELNAKIEAEYTYDKLVKMIDDFITSGKVRPNGYLGECVPAYYYQGMGAVIPLEEDVIRRIPEDVKHKVTRHFKNLGWAIRWRCPVVNFSVKLGIAPYDEYMKAREDYNDIEHDRSNGLLLGMTVPLAGIVIAPLLGLGLFKYGHTPGMYVLIGMFFVAFIILMGLACVWSSRSYVQL